MDATKIMSYVSKFWDDSLIPALSKFITIPCQSPPFDPYWKTNGYFDQAFNLIIDWIKAQEFPGLQAEIVRIEGKTPFLYVEIPGSSDRTTLFYGHIDKMPASEGWDEGLGAWTPVIRDNKLYGRGTSDDGYSGFAPIAALKAIREQNLPHGRCVLIMEATEECGSVDFPDYLELLKKRIGNPELVIVLDSDGENFDQMWCVSALRGLINGSLKVEILKNGIHSGTGSGIVPSTFRIMRQILSRIEDEKTGEILLPEFWTEIPPNRIEENKYAASIVGPAVYKHLPFIEGAQPYTDNVEELMLNQTWRPFLEIIGAEGMPHIAQAGNVLRASTEVQLSIRMPPTIDSPKVVTLLKEILEANPPHGAKVQFNLYQAVCGWNAPTFKPWLHEAMNTASNTYYGKPVVYKGQGGAIGIIAMMSKAFPIAQFVITGAAGPGSNAHVGNESLHIPTAKKITCCIADVLAKQLGSHS